MKGGAVLTLRIVFKKRVLIKRVEQCSAYSSSEPEPHKKTLFFSMPVFWLATTKYKYGQNDKNVLFTPNIIWDVTDFCWLAWRNAFVWWTTTTTISKSLRKFFGHTWLDVVFEISSAVSVSSDIMLKSRLMCKWKLFCAPQRLCTHKPLWHALRYFNKHLYISSNHRDYILQELCKKMLETEKN